MSKHAALMAFIALLITDQELDAQNQIADFAGTGGCIRISNHPDLRPPEAITIECWSRLETTPGRLINMGDGISGHTNRAYDLSTTDATHVGWMFFEGSDAVHLEAPRLHESWTHLAMTFDSAAGLATLIVDGLVADQETHMVNGTPLVGHRIRSSSYPLVFGRNNDFSVWHLDGRMDQVRIWRRALPAEEIRCLSDVLISKSTVGDFPDLVEVWNLDGTAKSESGRHDGSVHGAVVFLDLRLPSLFFEVYCPTTPNSVGPGALLRFWRSTNTRINDFALEVTGCPVSTPGAFLAGLGRTDIPLGDGRLCVDGPSFLVAGLYSTGADGTLEVPVDISQVPPDTVANFQFVYLDPDGATSSLNLSDAVSIEFCRDR